MLHHSLTRQCMKMRKCKSKWVKREGCDSEFYCHRCEILNGHKIDTSSDMSMTHDDVQSEVHNYAVQTGPLYDIRVRCWLICFVADAAFQGIREIFHPRGISVIKNHVAKQTFLGTNATQVNSSSSPTNSCDWLSTSYWFDLSEKKEIWGTKCKCN